MSNIKGSLLESDKVTGLSQTNRLQSSISPGVNLLFNIPCRLLAQVSLGHVLGVAALQDDLLGVSQNDTREANVLEPADGSPHLGSILASAELGVKGLFQKESQERVLVRIQHGVLGVGERHHDAQRRRQQDG